MRYIFFLFATIILLQGARASADASSPTSASSDKPVLLLLLGMADDQSIEAQYRAELSLQLETHELKVIDSFSFIATSAAGRIDELRPEMESRDAETAVWIESIGTDRFSLQVVSLAPGRAISRSLDVLRSDEAFSELVIGTRALLDEIYLDAGNSTPANPPDPVTHEPSRVRQKITGAVGVGFDFSVGLVGAEGSIVLLGGELSGMLLFSSGFHLQVCATGFASPDSTIEDASFVTGGIRPGLGVGWLHMSRRFFIGPTLLIEVPWQRVVVSDERGPEITHDWWSLRLVPSLETRFRVASRVQIGLRTGLGISLFSPVFEREDGSVIYAPSILDWNTRLGLIIELN